jgi:hypothetical protein
MIPPLRLALLFDFAPEERAGAGIEPRGHLDHVVNGGVKLIADSQGGRVRFARIWDLAAIFYNQFNLPFKDERLITAHAKLRECLLVESAATAIEYGLIAAGISVAIIAVIPAQLSRRSRRLAPGHN